MRIKPVCRLKPQKPNPASAPADSLQARFGGPYRSTSEREWAIMRRAGGRDNRLKTAERVPTQVYSDSLGLGPASVGLFLCASLAAAELQGACDVI